MPSSDSDSLPDLFSVLGPPKRKKTRPRPKASGPIELTSDDETKLPPPKRKRKSARKLSSPNVIDLCSDDNEHTPKPPGKARKSQTRAPYADEVIVLMSSDNEEPSGSRAMNDDRKSLSPAASVPPVEILRPESVSGQPELSTPQMDSSLTSPMADAHETTNPQANEVLPTEDEMTSEPLQHIYNEAFHNRSRCQEVNPSSPVFSWKSRSKPTQVCEPRPLPSSNPPLLTPGFFKRVREALAGPQNSTTSVQNDLVNGSSTALQRATTAVKSGSVPLTHSSTTSRAGEQECPKPLLPEPSPQKSQADSVTTIEDVSEDDSLPGISPLEVAEAGALHTTSSPTKKEPGPSKIPQTKFTAEQANILNVHETTDRPRRISPFAPSSRLLASSKTVPTDSRQINAFVPSEAEIQEIEAMLLPEVCNDITDEELLAMGLCYPEY